jgi:uncharacterized membrane protein YbhN (UPF0104 family)
MDTKKLFHLIFSLIITIAFIVLFEKYIGFENFLKLFKQISVYQFFIAFFFYFLSYLVRTYRWSFTLDLKEFSKLFKLTVYNTFFNIILPFRTGEVSFFYLLKKEGVHIVDSTMSFLITRIFDGLGLIAVFAFSYLTFKGFLYLALLSFLVIPFSFYVFVFILRFIKHEKIKSYNKDKLRFSNLAYIYLLSALTFILKFTAFYFIIPTQIDISFFQTILASAAADLTTILPIHGIAGIGTYESGYAGSLIFLFDIDKNTAFLLSFLVHTFILFSSSLLFVLTIMYFRIFKSKN